MLEVGNFLVCQRVCLGNDRNQVDFGVQPTHDFDVQRLQGVTSWLDEVDTCVNAIVDNVHAVNLVLGLKVCIKSLLNIFHNWPPRIIIVDKVSKTRCVHHSQSKPHSIFDDVGAD